MEYPLCQLDSQNLKPLQRWSAKYYHCAQQASPDSRYCGPEGKCIAAFKTPGKFLEHLLDDHSDDDSYNCFHCSFASSFGNSESTEEEAQNRSKQRGIFNGENGHDDLFRHLVKEHIHLDFICGLCPYRASTQVHIAYHGFEFHNKEYISCVAELLKMNDGTKENSKDQPIDVEARDSLGFPFIYCPIDLGQKKPDAIALIKKHKVRELTDIPQLRRFQCAYCTVIQEQPLDLMGHMVKKHPQLPIACYELAPEFNFDGGDDDDGQVMSLNENSQNSKPSQPDRKVKDMKVTSEYPAWGGDADQDQDMADAPSSPGPTNVWEDDEEPIIPPVPSPKRKFGVRSNTPLVIRSRTPGRNTSGAVTPGRNTSGAITPGRKSRGATTPGGKRSLDDLENSDDEGAGEGGSSKKKPRGIVEKEHFFELNALGTPSNKLDRKTNWCTICQVAVSSEIMQVKIHLKSHHQENSLCCNFPNCKPAFAGSIKSIQKHMQSEHQKFDVTDDYYRKIVIPKKEWEGIQEMDKSKNHSHAGISRRPITTTVTRISGPSTSGSSKKNLSMLDKAKLGHKGLTSWTLEEKRKKERIKQSLSEDKKKIAERTKASKEKDKSLSTARKIGRPPKAGNSSSSTAAPTANTSGAKTKPKKTTSPAIKSNEKGKGKNKAKSNSNSSDSADGTVVKGRFCMMCASFDPQIVTEQHLIRHANELEKCGLCGFEWTMRSELLKHYTEKHPATHPPTSYNQEILLRRVRTKEWAANFLTKQLELVQNAAEGEESTQGMVCFMCQSGVDMMAGWGFVSQAKNFTDPNDFESHVYQHSQWASAICSWCAECAAESVGPSTSQQTLSKRYVIRSKYHYTDHILRHHKNKLPDYLKWKTPEQLSKMSAIEDHIKKAFKTFERHDVIDEKLENEIKAQIQMYEVLTGTQQNSNFNSYQRSVVSAGPSSSNSENPTTAPNTETNSGDIEFIVKQEPVDVGEAMEIDLPTNMEPTTSASATTAAAPKATTSSSTTKTLSKDSKNPKPASASGKKQPQPIATNHRDSTENIIMAGDESMIDDMCEGEEIVSVEGVGGKKLSIEEIYQTYDTDV